MLDCKKALNECNGDIEEAQTWLREQGLAKAAKKSSNVAAEGLVSILINEDNTKATMTELNSQTDFVAKNDQFIALTKQITTHAQVNNLNDAEALASSSIEGQEFTTFLNEKIAVIGENLVARKVINVEGPVVNGYVHMGKVGVILAAKCDDAAKEKTADLLKKVAMHAASMKPTVISYEDLSAEFIESENKAIIADIEKENEELVRLESLLKIFLSLFLDNN